MARHERLGRDVERPLDPVGGRLEREVAGRHPEPPLADDGQVAPPQAEHVEPAEEGGAGVQPVQRCGEPGKVGRDVGIPPGDAGEEGRRP